MPIARGCGGVQSVSAHADASRQPELASEDLGDEALADTLARAGVSPGDVDRVFATGGSSFVPAVQSLLGRRFGIKRLVGGEEMTSVTTGLAARARQVFAPRR